MITKKEKSTIYTLKLLNGLSLKVLINNCRKTAYQRLVKKAEKLSMLLLANDRNRNGRCDWRFIGDNY